MFEPPDAALTGRGARFDPVGGMQSHTGQLTRELDRRGVRHVVLTHRPPGSPAVERFGEHAVVHRFGLPLRWGRQLYSAPAAIAAAGAARRADLVHAHVGEDLAVLPIALAAARSASLPLVVTVHCSLRHTLTGNGPRALLLRVVGARIEIAACRRADQVIALTPRLAAHLCDDGVAEHRIDVIPSGVMSRTTPADAPDPFAGVGHPRVIYVGRIAGGKGLHTLVAAAARMRTDAAVVFVGDGPERAALERAIRRHGIGDRVHITWFIPHRHVPAALQHADVFCLPSLYEELGTALLEAMEAGLPIIASDTGGIPAAVGPAARLVPPGDAAALAAALDALLGDRAEAQRLAALARRRAGAWSWERLAGEVLAVYGRAFAAAAAANPREPTTAEVA